MSVPYATAGELVICEGGHVIATIAKDIPRGSEHDDSFFRWRQQPPKEGTPAKLVTCHVCGAPWFYGPEGESLHFEQGGWR